VGSEKKTRLTRKWLLLIGLAAFFALAAIVIFELIQARRQTSREAFINNKRQLMDAMSDSAYVEADASALPASPQKK
jgi:hypothetical protein